MESILLKRYHKFAAIPTARHWPADRPSVHPLSKRSYKSYFVEIPTSCECNTASIANGAGGGGGFESDASVALVVVWSLCFSLHNVNARIHEWPGGFALSVCAVFSFNLTSVYRLNWDTAEQSMCEMFGVMRFFFFRSVLFRDCPPITESWELKTDSETE